MFCYYYILIFGCAGYFAAALKLFVAVHGLCLVEVSRAYSLVADPRLYEVWVSAVTERGLCSMDSVLEAHGLVAP